MTKAEKAKHIELIKLLHEVTTTLSSLEFSTRQSQPVGSPFMARATDTLIQRAFAACKENGK